MAKKATKRKPKCKPVEGMVQRVCRLLNRDPQNLERIEFFRENGHSEWQFRMITFVNDYEQD